MVNAKWQLSLNQRSRLSAIAAWGCWIAFVLLLTIVVGKKTRTSENSVIPAYRNASRAWVNSEPIYKRTNPDGTPSVHGFLYLPASAVLTIPFAMLPQPIHEFAFRWLSIALLAWAMLRLAGVIFPEVHGEAFLIMTLCVIAPCVGPARAGQMNVVMAAMMALAVVDAVDKRWWFCALWLGLSVALKPQGIVLAALMIVLCPPLRLRGTVAIAAAFLVPFMAQSSAYVIEQYQLCVEKLRLSGRPSEADVYNNDLSGLLGVLGIPLTENLRWVLRLAAAALTLIASWLATRKKAPPHPLVVTLAVASVYLMLFNPRTEGGSYIVLAVPLAIYLSLEVERQRWFAVALLTAITLGWGFSYNFSIGIWMLGHRLGWTSTDNFRTGFGPYWLSPALAIVFLAYLIWTSRLAPPKAVPSTQKKAPASDAGGG